MSRSLLVAVLLAAASPLSGQGTGPIAGAPGNRSAAAIDREQTADQQAWHVLNRLGFGPRPGDVERVRAMWVDAWIARQLQPERLTDVAGDALAAHYPTLALAPADLLRQLPRPRQVGAARAGGMVDSAAAAAARAQARRASADVQAELLSMRVARAVVSERQLQEVMVDFWENHFNVFINKGPFARPYLVEFDRDVVRPRVLGRFRDLLGAVAKSPAMLFYLDNAQSQANADAPVLDPRAGARRARAAHGRRLAPPASAASAQRQRRGLNENYARELLELHTLGVDGGYTQADVIDVARALTGWTIAPPPSGAFVFRPTVHDAGAKTVLGRRLAAGRGIEDGEQVLDLLARHPATAHFIATKLVRRFVSDSPPPALVERAAATFLRTDGDIREVVRTIVTSPEFFAAAVYRGKVKSPFELVVSAARALDATADPTPRTAQLVARLGQPIFGHQAPNGWPESGDTWINSGAILNRINFGIAAAGGALPGADLRRWAGGIAPTGGDREAQVDAVTRALLGGAVSPDTRRILVSGDNPLLARESVGVASDRMASPAAGADPASARRDPLAPRRARPLVGLAQILGLALGSPEFQRR